MPPALPADDSKAELWEIDSLLGLYFLATYREEIPEEVG
jgi:hypothetical protein